jgi:hypothetical protein
MAGRWSAVRHSVHKLAAKGWRAPSIASAYGMTTADVLAILQGPPPKASRSTPEPKWRDEWKQSDWRFKDDVGPDGVFEVLAPLAAAELLDQAGAAAIPPAMLEAPPVEPWSGPSSPFASPGKPRKITAAVLAEALRLRALGATWPAIARKFGCHRMAFYHAIRRRPPA